MAGKLGEVHRGKFIESDKEERRNCAGLVIPLARGGATADARLLHCEGTRVRDRQAAKLGEERDGRMNAPHFEKADRFISVREFEKQLYANVFTSRQFQRPQIFRSYLWSLF